MSKVPLRARALDAAKPMPVFSPDELPDLCDYAACNRTISALPTGVDKEEEMELHLQQALSAQQASSTGAAEVVETAFIPVPDVAVCPEVLETIYKADYAPSKLLIKVQAALCLEPEIPDYDLDSEDEEFLAKLRASEMVISDLQFEGVMERLEKNTDHTVTSFDDAKVILTDFDDDIIAAVYDYWLGKRCEARQALIPRVKTEKRDGSTSINPYVAFRRRAERMQTRKNRKNDEDSYEKILRLSQDLRKAVTLLEMVKRREKTKREMLNMDVEVVERRYSVEDWHSSVYNEILRETRPSHSFGLGAPPPRDDPSRPPKTARPKKSKRPKPQAEALIGDRGLASREWLQQNLDEWNRPWSVPGSSPGSHGRRNRKPLGDADGSYTFRRLLGCVYYAPSTMGEIKRPNPASRLQPHPIPLEPDLQKRREEKREPPKAERLHNLFLRSFTGGLRHVGPARARRGRGGRLIFDRSLGDEARPAWDPDASTSDAPALPPPHTSASTGPASAASAASQERVSFFVPRDSSERESEHTGSLASQAPVHKPLPDPPSQPLLSAQPWSNRLITGVKRPAPSWNEPVQTRRPQPFVDSDGEESGDDSDPIVLIETPDGLTPRRLKVGVSAASFGAHQAQVHLQKLESRQSRVAETPSDEPPLPAMSKEGACLSTSAVMTLSSVMKLVSTREPMLNQQNNNNKLEAEAASDSKASSAAEGAWNGDEGKWNGGGGSEWSEPAAKRLALEPSSTWREGPLPTPSPSPTHSGSQDGLKAEEKGVAPMSGSAVNSQASPSLAISPPESITTAVSSSNGDMDVSQSFHQIQRPIVR